MNILELLPATAMEVAAQLGCTNKQAHGRLHYERALGWARLSDAKVPNGTTKQGAKYSKLWERVTK